MIWIFVTDKCDQTNYKFIVQDVTTGNEHTLRKMLYKIVHNHAISVHKNTANKFIYTVM